MLTHRLLIRLLTLLLGFFYLGGVCELDADERRQHYAQEQHDSLGPDRAVEIPAPAAAVPSDLPEKHPALPHWRDVWPILAGLVEPVRGWPVPPDSPPPLRRRYLLLAVLQV